MLHGGFVACHALHLPNTGMIDYPQKESYSAEDLCEIIKILRDPQTGCPWDKVQTHASIRMNFLEEAYEAVDALDADDPVLLCEELGDVLMQVAFHTCIEEETGRFTWQQICDGVCRKLINRHPNIFTANSAQRGIKDWDTLKNMEKGRKTLAEDLQSVPKAMPALMRAAKLQKRASRYGVEAPQSLQLSAQPLDEQAVGELLFAAVALARASGVDAEQALQKANDQFAAQGQ